MKLGYSLLLGEYIQAEAVEYEDCKNFQITCPGCSEPVFKGIKIFPSKTEPTHYFAHYEKSKSLVEDCELRVGTISPQDISKVQAAARNQRMEFFLKVFSDAIHRMFKVTSESLEKPMKLWWMVDKLKRSKPVSVDLFNPVYESHRIAFAKMSDEELNQIFDFYIKEFGVEYLDKYTEKSFSIVTQKRIAIDFYRHLVSAPVLENFKLLYTAGYFMLIYRTIIAIQLKQPPAEDFEPQLNHLVLQLPEVNRKKGQMLLNRMAGTKIHYRSGLNSISLLGKMQSEITHEIFGVLLKIEYLELLKKAKEDSFGVLNNSIIDDRQTL